MAKQVGIKKFLKTLAPDFCWCTWFDLFLMMEQINEDVNEDSFQVSLCQLKNDGWFITKEDRDNNVYNRLRSNIFRGRQPLLYLRVKHDN